MSKFFETFTKDERIIINPMYVVAIRQAGAETEILLSNGDKVFSKENIDTVRKRLSTLQEVILHRE